MSCSEARHAHVVRRVPLFVCLQSHGPHLRGDARDATLGVAFVLFALLLLVIRVFGRACAVRHDERDAENVVETLLFPSREQLARAVELPLRGHRHADFARAELHACDLGTHRGVEQQVHGERDEANATSEALQVDLGDEHRGPRELQAGSALHEDRDTDGDDDAVDRAIELHLPHRDSGQVSDVLPEHAHLCHRHLPACGVAGPALAIVKFEVAPIVVEPEDAIGLCDASNLG
mmetsp:Transcript_45531/g.130540  ORF Transcript_45531/g.130540 Transcript_45531/m.130540 type:complete len:234 (-) Transcript_45531:77-778(-)